MPKTLFDLRSRECHWPIGRDGEVDMMIFCGRATAQGQQYCPHHHDRAHSGIPEPVDVRDTDYVWRRGETIGECTPDLVEIFEGWR